jgi:rod shape-determining protein MreD
VTPAQYLLRPVNPAFIALSFIFAFLFDLLPWGDLLWVPDMVALVLVFWNIHQPRKVGMGVAFVLGLLMDVHDARLLGEHAMAYTLLAYFAITIHRRVLWFTVHAQALHVLPLLFVTHAVPVAIRLAMGAPLPGWPLLLAPGIEALLWPLATSILLAPQRRSIDVDETRPI